ncbi:MAG: class I SAM-dependent methyltransferase [Planctomycetota bacterium]|nr:class I SAM-dependent methyltransferase [Planctomycetota bacterium]
MLTVRWWQERLYPPQRAKNPAAVFSEELYRHVKPDSRVLDIGAGAGKANTYALRGKCAEVVGIDLDPRVLENPLLDRGVVGNMMDTPFDGNSFDVAFSIYTLEHVTSPAAFVTELHRIIKPGGRFLALTPNRYHYVSLVASCTPHAFHRWFNRKRGRCDEDTFSTVYQLNTKRALNRCFLSRGFEQVLFKTIEVEPNYLKWCVPAFLCGTLYERLVNSTGLLEFLRVNIICGYAKNT